MRPSVLSIDVPEQLTAWPPAASIAALAPADAEWMLQELFGCELAHDGLLYQLNQRASCLGTGLTWQTGR